MPNPDIKQGTSLLPAIIGSGCVNPQYVVSFTGSPTGGTFALTITTGVNGPTPNAQTATITYSTTLTAAAVQAAIQALTGMSTVTVSGSSGGPFTATVPNTLGVATVTVNGASLTGGSSPAAAVATQGVDTTIVPAVSANTAVKVTSAVICNASNALGTLSVSVVPSGGSVDGTHRVLSNYSLLANDTISHEDVMAMTKENMYPAGTFVSINCTSPVTYMFLGVVSS